MNTYSLRDDGTINHNHFSPPVDLQEAKQLIDSQAKNVVQAEKALKIAEVRYDSGIGTQLELFDAQLALERTHMGYIQGIYNYNTAKFDWEKSVGL